MPDVEFWSTGRRFGLRLKNEQVVQMLRLCERSFPHETGGILLGRYTVKHDCAVVTSITKAPTDSQSGRTWFVRGIKGLQHKVDRMWNRNQSYYLGEWHLHPGGTPRPSSVDIGQMREIATSAEYHCPEPVLLIIGYNPPSDWSARAYVFRRKGTHLEMRATSLRGFTVGELVN